MSIFDSISHGIGRLSDSPFSNPNKIFGLDLWGREQRGGPADQWENKFQNRTGLPTATVGRYNQHYGPQTAGLIAGSILAGGGSGGELAEAAPAGAEAMPAATPMMPPATPESPATLQDWGMTQTGPGQWSQPPMSSPSGQYRPSSMGGQNQHQQQMAQRPHDYLAYLLSQPQQPALSQPLGQGTFWGGGQSPMAKGLFGYG